MTETMKDTVEESWSLSPAYVASAEESSVSIVPSYESISFSLPGVAISGIDTYVEQEETDTSVVQ